MLDGPKLAELDPRSVRAASSSSPCASIVAGGLSRPLYFGERAVAGHGRRLQARDVAADESIDRERRAALNRRLRQAFLDGAEEQSRRGRGRGLTDAELKRVMRRYPGDLPER